MFNWLKKLFNDKGDGFGVGDLPVIHDFPNLGVDGQVTINCIVRTSPGAYGHVPRIDQQADGGVAGVGPTCVGALLVEVDEMGLSLRWQPRQAGEEVFPSPFGRPSAAPRFERPAADRAK